MTPPPAAPDEETLAIKAGERLDSIHRAADSARLIMERGRTAWNTDPLLRLAGEAVLIRVGEAAKAVPAIYVPELPGVDWRGFIRTRDFVAHNQDRIDPSMLWNDVTRAVPTLDYTLHLWRAYEEPEPWEPRTVASRLGRPAAERTRPGRDDRGR